MRWLGHGNPKKEADRTARSMMANTMTKCSGFLFDFINSLPLHHLLRGGLLRRRRAPPRRRRLRRRSRRRRRTTRAPRRRRTDLTDPVPPAPAAPQPAVQPGQHSPPAASTPAPAVVAASAAGCAPHGPPIAWACLPAAAAAAARRRPEREPGVRCARTGGFPRTAGGFNTHFFRRTHRLRWPRWRRPIPHHGYNDRAARLSSPLTQ